MKKLSLLPAIALMVIANCTVAFGQEAEQGAITGYVFDSSNALLPMAEVTVTSRETNRARVEKTSAAGIYTFASSGKFVGDRGPFS